MFAANANSGIGLWTMICKACCSLIGKESQAVIFKKDGVLLVANARLNAKLNKKNATNYSDYRVVWTGTFDVTVSVMATINDLSLKEFYAKISKVMLV